MGWGIKSNLIGRVLWFSRNCAGDINANSKVALNTRKYRMTASSVPSVKSKNILKDDLKEVTDLQFFIGDRMLFQYSGTRPTSYSNKYEGSRFIITPKNKVARYNYAE